MLNAIVSVQIDLMHVKMYVLFYLFISVDIAICTGNHLFSNFVIIKINFLRLILAIVTRNIHLFSMKLLFARNKVQKVTEVDTSYSHALK